MDSVFRVLEPVLGKINERAKAPPTFGSRFGLRPQRSDWFRVYRVRLLVSSEDLQLIDTFAGLLLTVRVLRLDLPQGQDCHPLYQRFRNYGSH